MIFVTTGTQAPFDRLVNAIDEIAGMLPSEIIIQAFSTRNLVDNSNIKLMEFIPQSEFDRYYDEAELIVSHAGTGSIISALTRNKPIIVLPRKASLGEHRNEHQLATARKFYDLGLLEVAFEENELKEKILGFVNRSHKLRQKTIDPYASSTFLRALKEEF